MNAIKAIILGAGQGRRLMPLTEHMPKCCLQLDGKSMLEWQLEALAANNVRDIVVVTGFGHNVVDDVISHVQDIPVRTLYNPFHALTDNLGTCWVARGEMTTPFLLVNGDTLFEPALLDRLLASTSNYPITLATDQKGQYDEDDMKVITDQGQLLGVGKRLDAQRVNGESIGMMVFDQTGADAFVQQIEQLMRTPEGMTRWYLSAIDDLAQAGEVGVHSINGLNWCEVDNPHDLAHARKTIGSWQQISPAISPAASNHVIQGLAEITIES